MLKTKIIKIDPDKIDIKKIKEAAKILKKGGLLAYPTDTVYGLGADCYNKKALKKIYEIKKRPGNKPLPVQIDKTERLNDFNIKITEDAKILMDKFWPGPLTLILETKNKDKIGFRIPANKIAKTLLKEYGHPICAPSANFSASPACLDAHSVIVSFDGLIEGIIDGAICPGGVESTVVDLSQKPYRVLREGAISLKELEACFKEKGKFIKVKNIIFVCTGNSCRSVMAKGLLIKEIAGDKRFKVESAGIFTLSGMPPTKETIEVMASEGIDVSKEKGQQITDSVIDKSDLILVMQPRHKDYILKLKPEAKDKVFLLKEYKNKEKVDFPDIKDPVGQSISVYEKVLKEIREEIERIVNLI